MSCSGSKGRREMEGREDYLPLFETKEAEGKVIYKVFAASIFVGIWLIWVYRASQLPRAGEEGRWAWIVLFSAELWFGIYWVFTQSLRWNRIHRLTFKDRLALRYHEKELPRVDIFVCTADSKLEPPIMVINTVLSVMAYHYPPEKLSVYLSDDGCSELTFYGLLEASHFSKYWIPFCKRFKVEPRSPQVYFNALLSNPLDADDKEAAFVKRLYEDMKDRIEKATTQGTIPQEIRQQHKGLLQFDGVSSQHDHDTILQIIIDGRDPNALDIEDCMLPTLVYLAREKRPQHHHNFKAGAINALLRVSSQISSGKIILNVDCDMHSNNAESVRDAVCFFMDEKQGDEIAYVQFPQGFSNITKNEIYGGSARVFTAVEFPGLDGYGGPVYIGTGCFHRREALYGKKYSKQHSEEWKGENNDAELTKNNLNEPKKTLESFASCLYEKDTQWGKQIGLKYGCPVEDSITGLSIQCRGWKSAYFNPSRKGFLGLAPVTLGQLLVQQKRWYEGHFQILLSKYNAMTYGHGKISLGLRMAYCLAGFWAPSSIPTLCYVILPSLCLLRGIPLFPKVSSPWFLPFAYVIIGKHGYSLGEFVFCGGTFNGWWNVQRMWIFTRAASSFFAFIDTTLKLLGFGKPAFEITAKVVTEEVRQRYELEMMEFGASSSPMFSILAIIALLNLFSLVGFMEKAKLSMEILVNGPMSLQILLCVVLILINLPVYQALFLRKDSGRLPRSLAIKSVVFALLICACVSSKRK